MPRNPIPADDSWKQRYATAVYLIVGLIGLIAGMLSLVGKSPQPASALSLGFGSSLLAGAVTFLVLRVFLLDRDMLSESKLNRIEALIEGKSSRFLLTRQQVGLSQVIESVSTSKKIAVLGYALDRFMDDAEDDIVKALRNDCDIRVMMVSRDGPAGDLVRSYSQSPAFPERASRTIAVLDRIRRAVPNGRIEVRWLDWIPSCAIYMLEYPNGQLMQVEAYPPAYNTSPGNRPVLLFRDGEETEWCNFFSEQYERLWATGRTLVSAG